MLRPSAAGFYKMYKKFGYQVTYDEKDWVLAKRANGSPYWKQLRGGLTPCRANQTVQECLDQPNCLYDYKRGCREYTETEMTPFGLQMMQRKRRKTRRRSKRKRPLNAPAPLRFIKKKAHRRKKSKKKGKKI
jgi:hypothetical protein